jgi:DNA modification methylase
MTYAFNKHFQELAAATQKWDLLYECIWVKQHFAFIIGRRFQPQHEPILIFRRQGGQGTFNVPPSQSTVFKHDKASANEDHPTSRPIALWNNLVAFHSDPKDIVYEPFSGGGTSFIACEQLERRCIGLEIQPQYCQVTLDRWEAFTGQRATKVGEAVS